MKAFIDHRALAIICTLLLFYSIYANLSLYELEQSSSQKIFSLNTTLNWANKNISQLNSKLLNTRNQLQKTNQSLMQTTQQLNQEKQKYKQTKSLLEQTNNNLTQTQTQLYEAQTKVELIKQDVYSLQQNLNESMSWFKQNSQIDSNYSWDVEIFLKRINSDCIYNNVLNLACINYLNERTVLHLEYLNDSDAGEMDHLQSLQQTIKRRGGDCEDYSLFFKAILQTLKSKQDLYIQGWVPLKGREYRIWPQVKEPETYVYYPDAAAVTLSNLKDTTPYVMCYTVDYTSGHCRIALSEKNITSSTTHNLVGATVFEPQNGRYAGIVGENYSVCNQTQQDCYRTPGAITLLISQNDIIQIKDSNWVSYNDYLQQTKQISANLN